MKISDRLKKVAEFVDTDATVLDIGCDHALLDIYLVKNNKKIKCIAADVKEGPLNQAKENIKREKLDKVIETRLGSGLDTYTDDINTVVISGLGGKTMMGIFKYKKNIVDKLQTIIISPNNYQQDIKRLLTHMGFIIEKEEFVKDKKIIYQVIKLVRGKKHYTKRELFFGPILLQNKNNLFKEFYKREKTSREILISVLPSNFKMKKFFIKREIKKIEKELEF